MGKSDVVAAKFWPLPRFLFLAQEASIKPWQPFFPFSPRRGFQPQASPFNLIEAPQTSHRGEQKGTWMQSPCLPKRDLLLSAVLKRRCPEHGSEQGTPGAREKRRPWLRGAGGGRLPDRVSGFHVNPPARCFAAQVPVRGCVRPTAAESSRSLCLGHQRGWGRVLGLLTRLGGASPLMHQPPPASSCSSGSGCECARVGVRASALAPAAAPCPAPRRLPHPRRPEPPSRGTGTPLRAGTARIRPLPSRHCSSGPERHHFVAAARSPRGRRDLFCILERLPTWGTCWASPQPRL